MSNLLNPSHIGGVRAYNDLYQQAEDEADDTTRKRTAQQANLGQGNTWEEDTGDLAQTTFSYFLASSSSALRKLYVGNLPPSVTEKPLKEYFAQFGEVQDCRVN